MNLLPEDLRAATIAVKQLDGVSSIRDWIWDSGTERWVGHFQLSIVLNEGALVPPVTEWYVSVANDYPWGSIKFYPAKANGICQTFPHQTYNAAGPKENPWRTGDLCLNTSVRVLNRQGLETEPFEGCSRLSWHFLRALEWLKRAGTGSLLEPGDPFELPQFPLSSGGPTLLAFKENEHSYRVWQSISKQIGIVDVSRVPGNAHAVFVKAVRALDGREIWTPEWGQAFSQTEISHRGVWIRLSACPLAGPWQAPRTWGELRRAVRDQADNLDRLLRAGLNCLRDGMPHLLLIGFPVQSIVGGPPVQMHWMAIALPILSQGTLTQNGFRSNALGFWMRDRQQLLPDGKAICWQKSQNWSVQELGARGHLSDKITCQHVVLIGGGALGSAIAELLVRSGVSNLTIIDGEIVEAGNLVRHTLTVDDVLASKAVRLAQRLNATSPHARIVAIPKIFPDLDSEEVDRIQSADTIIDCTGADGVLFALSQFRWHTKKRFISLSLGLYARRLFCFSTRFRSFPVQRFHQLIEPWLARERRDFEGNDLPREGIGCWHPVFPARADDVWMFAAVATKFFERELMSSDDEPHLVVYEQVTDDTNFTGIRRAGIDE